MIKLPICWLWTLSSNFSILPISKSHNHSPSKIHTFILFQCLLNALQLPPHTLALLLEGSFADLFLLVHEYQEPEYLGLQLTVYASQDVQTLEERILVDLVLGSVEGVPDYGD